MNVHGAALPVKGERLARGHSWGTFSNLVLSLTAVVWDPRRHRYELKTFERDDRDIGPLLTSLARAFITEVTLQMGPALKVRCHSRVDIPTATMCAPPESAGPDSYAALVEQNGSVEVLWDVFSQGTWTKTWTVAPTKPATSREVTTPYNYPTNVPEAQADQITAMLRNNPPFAAYFSLQRAVHEFYTYFSQKLGGLAQAGQFPFAGNVDWRAQGLDDTDDVIDRHAVEPHLSGARPVPRKREYDTILWFALNTNVGQPGNEQFFTEVEDWFLSNYRSYAIVRPEWTKAYAFSAAGGWTDTNKLKRVYPDTFGRRFGYAASEDWDRAVDKLKSYDPDGVFTNQFLDKLLA